MAASALPDSARQQWRLLLGGAWINTTYAAYLRKTHSPRQAHGHWGRSGITELSLDPQPQPGDSMALGLVTANHEGLPQRYVHLLPGPVRNSWPTTAQESGSAAGLLATSLRYHLTRTDTLLYLDQRHKQTHQLTTTAFQKLRGASIASPSYEALIGPFINELTVAGSYLVTDSTGHTYPARWLPAGHLQGWPGHSRYQVTTDFIGPFRELDTVIFDSNQQSEQEWAFTKQADTLRLYAVHDDTLTYKRQRGRPTYTLIRQPN